MPRKIKEFFDLCDKKTFEAIKLKKKFSKYIQNYWDGGGGKCPPCPPGCYITASPGRVKQLKYKY